VPAHIHHTIVQFASNLVLRVHGSLPVRCLDAHELEVHAWLDRRQYEESRKVTDAQLSEVRIKRNKFHGDWNYEILPSQ